MPPSQSANILQSVGDELKMNPPKVLQNTLRKYGPVRANKQRIAILLSKGRKLGAKVGKKSF